MTAQHLVALAIMILSVSLQADVFQSEEHVFEVELVASIDDPWGMAFVPNGDILVTQKNGELRIVRHGRLLASAVSGLPKMVEKGQGGLMDVTLDPDFANNRLIYLSYTGARGGDYGTEVLRGRLEEDALSDVEVIFKALPKRRGGRHFGSRLLFAADGLLYISLGDRGHRPNGQDLSSHPGSLIRIQPNGSVPLDNPFVEEPLAKDPGTLPEIYTYGNRNMQGMALHPLTGEVWAHEHGPQGGDEVNIMRAGHNYGWAEITYGVNYGIGTKVGEGKTRSDVTPPVHYWVPSIAPSGMAFYTGDLFPKWKNNLFVGSLKFQQLVRLELGNKELGNKELGNKGLHNNQVVDEERISFENYGRIRDVRQGPDGHIYVLTEGGRGGLLKVSPGNTD